MRYLGILLIVSLLGITYGDEIVKKDGSVLKGKIIEESPGKYYKIKMRDGSILVVKQEETETVKYGGEPFLSRQKPCIACCLSLLVPGIGQVYNGEYKKAGIFFIGAVIAGVVAYSDRPRYDTQGNLISGGGPVYYVGSTCGLAITLWSAIDAYRTAQKINRARGYGAIFNFENGRLALGMPMVKINDDRKGNYQLKVVNMQF